jgi:hypothetical protein
MPRAGDAQAVDVALVQGSAGVAAGVGQGADLPGKTVEEHLVAGGRDLLRLPFVQLGVVQHVGPVIEGLLEGGVIDADAPAE